MVKMNTKIWTPDFAYGIGLLTTDGNLSPDGRHIEFCSKDIELILNFKQAFGLKNKIGKKRRGGHPSKLYYRIQFGSIERYKFFVKIGLSPRKSLLLRSIRIPDNLFSDFLRGVIDGDGSIGYFIHPESKEKQFRIRIASGSLLFLKWLRSRISKILKLKGSVQKISTAHELCYYKQASARLAEYIYYGSDILFLSRKYKIARMMKKCEGGETGTRASLRS